MILGVFAGLSLRAFSLPLPAANLPPGSSCQLAGVSGMICCNDDHHHDRDCGDHSCDGATHADGSECHHHHHFCCSPGFLTLGELNFCRLPMPSSLPLGVQLSGTRVPDGPFFELEKPPLN